MTSLPPASTPPPSDGLSEGADPLPQAPTAHAAGIQVSEAEVSEAEVSEAHPASRLAETLRRLPAYLRLTRALIGDRRLGRLRKGGLAAGLAYLASPIDLVPGIVPVLGQLDDLAAVLLAIRFALRGLPGPAADAMLGNVGLSRELLARDLDNVRVGGVWAAKGAARTGARVARAGIRVAQAGGRAARRSLGAASTVAKRAVRAVGARRR